MQYTEYGIPHISATSYTGLGLGYGYASAKDNVCLLADIYLTVRAERARYLGPDAPASGLVTAANSLDSDLYFARTNASGVVERLIRAPAPHGPHPEVVDLVRGYVSGYNRYLRQTGVGGITDPACRGAEWVRPITDLDVYRHLYALATMSGTGSLVTDIVTAAPPAGATAAPALIDPAATARQITAAVEARRTGQELGSNAIAVGDQGSRGARGALLGNPHFPWQGARRFWQSHLTIPGRLDVSGASLLGLPMVLIGHNRHVAWSHTVSTAATIGLFEMPTTPGRPTEYVVDGAAEAMTTRAVSVEVRQPDGTLRTVGRTFYETRYGPVVTSAYGTPLPWGTTVHAVRDANATNVRLLNTWLGIATSRDTAGIARALAANQGAPWVNTVAADRDGRTLYADYQAVPHVTDEQALSCGTPLGRQMFPLAGISVLDGSRGDCAWGTDADAVEPGIFGTARLPSLVRRDYVANFNDSPWLTNARAPLTGYPRGVGDVGTRRSFRTQEGVLSVEARIDGTDGLAGRGHSLETLAGAFYGNHGRVADLARDGIARMCAAFPGGKAPVSGGGLVDVGDGCAALSAWDGSFRLDSRGALLFSWFISLAGRVPGGYWQQPFDPAAPLTTPHTLAADRVEVQRAFGDAALRLEAAGIPLDAPLGDHQSVTRSGTTIPVHGAGPHVGLLNVVQPVWDATRGNVEVSSGSSFVQVVEFRAGSGPRVRTVLTYSQSADPTSPHYADQTLLYSASQWVTGRFTAQEIRSSPAWRAEVVTG
ncbi:penicillin acylase family protein [Micromonospora haikouensis]|uniref:penicillin acylase family protein n=1 Tax=Micromonospora haikouensis TaxID=686309 RepID=UPI001C402951|nr:penicillin acylase family protein [Micromonospora haikouensis]